jgi:uncharacterized membrane protein YjjP (DUF1212 family)
MSIEASLNERISFIVELARRLHQYGTAAPRLEDAVTRVCERLGLSCHVMSSPTSVIISFTESSAGEDALAAYTQVIRLSPGGIDLGRLCQVDEIADRVISGELDIAAGYRALRALRLRRGTHSYFLTISNYGLASASVAAILHGAWVDVGAAAVIGAMIGALALLSQTRPRLLASFDALSAMLATFVATLISAWWTPLSVNSVILAGVIVLLPGLTLTTAVRELSTQHLVSGVARLAGALAILLKLTFGTVAAAQLCKIINLVPLTATSMPIPGWAEWVMLGAGCFAFAVLFRTARRDMPVVMASALLGYLITFYGSYAFSREFGVFLAGLIMGALANGYAVLARKPSALVRLPGIILLVPGTVGFQTLGFVLQRDVLLGVDTAFSLVALLVSLVAGLLFGDLLIAPRRSL